MSKLGDVSRSTCESMTAMLLSGWHSVDVANEFNVHPFTVRRHAKSISRYCTHDTQPLEYCHVDGWVPVGTGINPARRDEPYNTTVCVSCGGPTTHNRCRWCENFDSVMTWFDYFDAPLDYIRVVVE